MHDKLSCHWKQNQKWSQTCPEERKPHQIPRNPTTTAKPHPKHTQKESEEIEGKLSTHILGKKHFEIPSPWQSSILHLRLDGLYTSNSLWGMANLERSERENKERKSNVPPSALDSIPGVSMLGCQCFVKYQFSGLNYLIIFDFIVLGLLGFLFKWSTLVDCWSQCFLSVFGQLFGNWQKRGTPSCSCTEFSQFNPFACETYIYMCVCLYIHMYIYVCIYIYTY